MSPEDKVLQKIRSVLIADAVIESYTRKRVYASHISSIQEPVYPAISLFLLSSNARFHEFDYVDMDIQIDAWLLLKNNNIQDVLELAKKIRACLHRQNLTDSTISSDGLIVALCSESEAGPFLYEEDMSIIHYPMRYKVIAK